MAHFNGVSFDLKQLDQLPKGQFLLAQARRNGSVPIPDPTPDPGLHIIPIKAGEVVQLVIDNYDEVRARMCSIWLSFLVVMGLGDGRYGSGLLRASMRDVD